MDEYRWQPHSYSRRGWLLRFGAIAAIVGAEGCSVPAPSNSLIDAVYHRDEARARALIASGADIEERKSDESTPLLLAVTTDQFVIAEMLIDAGANIWATSEFGDSVGWATEKSKLAGGPDAEARDRIMIKLRNRGFPFPAEHRSIVLGKVESGQWPPHVAAAGR